MNKIYEIWYDPYVDWEPHQRVGVYQHRENAENRRNTLNKEYWNRRNPYYLKEVALDD